MTLMPRESAKLIARMSKNVFIEDEGVKNLACTILEGLKNNKISVNNFSQHEYHPSMDDPRAVDWIFVLDTLNYSFWRENDSSKWWTVNGQSGYFALCSAIKRAIDEGIPIIDPKYYSRITRSDAEKIFRGDNQNCCIPLLDERLKSLREAGKILLGKYQGTFAECIKSCSCSAEQLMKLVVNEFESYQDEADYEGHRDVELENGGDDEIEIRGCSIEATERVKDEVRALIERYPNLKMRKSDVNAILIDHFLWDYRREHAIELEHIPFHKTRCIYY
ncbi:queuosine 5'-phosphate N-glycosylase/hydrolase isoform X2 [Lasioglossum baleicum]|uniref:queuosine 5'-phosphate N-glycosylase/hydrolase isoform X2 n=1 Tax=Lasioglossum baleicum TaxID=434251 RepID=UPI003FCCAA63